MRPVVLPWLLFVLPCFGLAAQEASADSPDAGAINQRFADYLDAYNAGSADTVGSFWSEDAVSLDEETGERASGREAVVAGFAEFFANAPGSRLTGTINRVRSLRPDIAIAEGAVTLFVADAEPVPSAFTAVLVKERGQWLIESSYERPLPSPTSRGALQDLAWLVGEWRDQTEGVEMNTTVRWSANGAFLIRSFRADYGDNDDAFEGTQIIGWDPRANQYRTWTFNSDGSFGEGTVSRSGDQWLIRMSHVLTDGSVSAGTQVLQLVDSDTMCVERIGQTVDGAPVPAGEPVTVVRVGPSEAASQSGGPLR